MKYNKELFLQYLNEYKAFYENCTPGIILDGGSMYCYGLCYIVHNALLSSGDGSLNDISVYTHQFLSLWKPANAGRWAEDYISQYWFPTLPYHCTITQEMIDESITPRLNILNKIIEYVDKI